MSQTYTVKLVTEPEWAELVKSNPRYAHVDETNLGFSDPPNRRAYVRESVVKQWPGAKQYLLEHEFEHLVSDEKWHEDEHGIRHKKVFKELIAPIALPLLGGALLGPIGGALGGTLGGIAGTGLGAAAGGAGAAKIRGGDVGRSALTSGLLGAATAGVGPALKAFSRTGATAPVAAAPLATSSPGGGSSNIVSKLFGGGAGTALSPVQGAGGGAKQPFFSFLGGSGGGGGGGGGSPFGVPFKVGAAGGLPTTAANVKGALSAFQPGTQTGGSGNRLTGMLAPAGLGLGISALGSLKKTPEVPDLGQLPAIQQFRGDVTSRFQPLAQRLQGLSNTPLPSALESPIRRQYANQRKRLYGQFAAAAPGTSLLDTEYRRAEEDLGQREAESIANAQLGFQSNERQNIVAQLGLSESELSVLGQLAGLDIQTIMAQTGLAAEEANQIKQLFGNLGSTVAGAGILGQFLV